MEIALISDNHSFIGPEVIENMVGVDEIWHAGDIGEPSSLTELKSIAPIVGVYGNIDDIDIRAEYPLNQTFEREGVKVFMTHIGGYPGKYTARVKALLVEEKPDIYICGHSHICKVLKDKKLDLLHMNPGAYGHHGFHKFRTFLRFTIEAGKVNNLRVIELGIRGKLDYENPHSRREI